MTRCRTNFHSESEAMINKQINMELYASYVYLSMVNKARKSLLIKLLWCTSQIDYISITIIQIFLFIGYLFW